MPHPAVEGFANLRRFVRRNVDAKPCELRASELGTEHEHLFDPRSRALLCVCGGCSTGGGGFLPVPRRVRRLDQLQLSDAEWEDLRIPIEMAFFFESSPAGRVMAMYPSPAGATESLLPLEAWMQIVEQNPELRTMAPDVEALLVNRVRLGVGASGHSYYLVPIDHCYELVGLIRTHWRGFSGGTKVWEEVRDFFARLERANA